ncbi:hypothetical protein [Tenggerimyces flavus]|uniref:Terminase n=1 Tax=Tenggerimyces flavus TaxID=1708749 RepID=A0ABV7Y9L6_9ACTN|nr:hypothetical protein [Tenggerimyces flavus]MBM7788864.1 phage terminase large subunit-like protein [Tenggerimyces flavus]
MTISPPAALLGARAPRYRSVPPAVSSAGEEAVDLLKSAGRPPDDWQADALVDALAEREDGRWASSEVGLVVARQNGKGDILLGKALHSLYLTPVKLILWSAHEFKTVREMFLRVRETIDGCADLSRRVKTIRTSHGEEGVELRDGSRLNFVARSGGSGRGFSPEELLWDEAYALTDDQVAAQMPSTSAQPNPQIWYASSHPLVMSLVLRRICKRGRSGGAGLTYLEWAADKEASLDDRQAWVDANPGYGIRISEESIVRELGSMDPDDFARERLGVVELDEEQVVRAIDLELWKTLVDLKTARPAGPAVAVDTTPDRAFSAIGTGGVARDGRMHVDVLEHRAGTGWVVDEAVKRATELDACAVVLDPTGPAGSFIKEFNKRGFVTEPDKRKRQRQLHILGAREAAQAHGAFVDLANNNRLRHRDRLELNKALAGAKTRPLADAAAWSRKDSSVDISPLVAVTEAAYGFATYGAAEKPKRKPKFAFG